MLATTTVDISEKLYAHARRVAQTRHQEVSELMATILDENLPRRTHPHANLSLA